MMITIRQWKQQEQQVNIIHRRLRMEPPPCHRDCHRPWRRLQRQPQQQRQQQRPLRRLVGPWGAAAACA